MPRVHRIDSTLPQGRARRVVAIVALYLTPAWLLVHLVVVALATTMICLGIWQLDVSDARHFDLQNFTYTLQWWASTAFGLFMWARLMRDRWRKATGREPEPVYSGDPVLVSGWDTALPTAAQLTAANERLALGRDARAALDGDGTTRAALDGDGPAPLERGHGHETPAVRSAARVATTSRNRDPLAGRPAPGPAVFLSRPTSPGEQPVLYRGYVMPSSRSGPVRSHGDAYHDSYNDALWQLSLADGEDATPDGSRDDQPGADGAR